MRNVFALVIGLITIFMFSFGSCKKDNNTQTPSDINAGNDPNFKIVENTDNGFESFNRKVVVFGIPIYAVKEVDDLRLLHAANIMAQYLDNNEDGEIDNKQVLDAMKSVNAFVVMWKSEDDMESMTIPENAEGQDLGNDETIIEWHSNGHKGRFDAALEEILHIITHAGYANAYPEIFAEQDGSSLCNAMDVARGGHFTSIPNPYPAEAWYSYDDETCEYNCMATEYLYWALTSKLGAQKNRLNEINHEWKLNTPALLQSTDTGIFTILSDEQYKLPTVLPNGKYKQ